MMTIILGIISTVFAAGLLVLQHYFKKVKTREDKALELAKNAKNQSFKVAQAIHKGDLAALKARMDCLDDELEALLRLRKEKK